MRIFYVILYSFYFIDLGIIYAQAVGSETCKTCHLAIYQQWAQSVHAKSLLTIPPHQQRNPYCLSCHIDPLGKYITPFDLSKIDRLILSSAMSEHQLNTRSQVLMSELIPIEEYTQAVGCEACHGYATAYLKRGVKQAWWTLKYQSPQLSEARRKKKIIQLKKQAQKLGLKRGDDLVICKRCHEGISTHIKALDLSQALLKMKHFSTESIPKIKRSDEREKRSIIIKP